MGRLRFLVFYFICGGAAALPSARFHQIVRLTNLIVRARAEIS